MMRIITGRARGIKLDTLVFNPQTMAGPKSFI